MCTVTIIICGHLREYSHCRGLFQVSVESHLYTITIVCHNRWHSPTKNMNILNLMKTNHSTISSRFTWGYNLWALHLIDVNFLDQQPFFTLRKPVTENSHASNNPKIHRDRNDIWCVNLFSFLCMVLCFAIGPAVLYLATNEALNFRTLWKEVTYYCMSNDGLSFYSYKHTSVYSATFLLELNCYYFSAPRLGIRQWWQMNEPLQAKAIFSCNILMKNGQWFCWKHQNNELTICLAH